MLAETTQARAVQPWDSGHHFTRQPETVLLFHFTPQVSGVQTRYRTTGFLDISQRDTAVGSYHGTGRPWIGAGCFTVLLWRAFPRLKGCQGGHALSTSCYRGETPWRVLKH